MTAPAWESYGLDVDLKSMNYCYYKGGNYERIS